MYQPQTSTLLAEHLSAVYIECGFIFTGFMCLSDAGLIIEAAVGEDSCCKNSFSATAMLGESRLMTESSIIIFSIK